MSLFSSIKLAEDVTKEGHTIERHDMNMISTIHFESPPNIENKPKSFDSAFHVGAEFAKAAVLSSNTREEIFRL
jgi:hypothetical protein